MIQFDLVVNVAIGVHRYTNGIDVHGGLYSIPEM